MEKPFIFNFDELLELDQIYIPEEYFYQPFYDFDSSSQSDQLSHLLRIEISLAKLLLMVKLISRGLLCPQAQQR
jgi:hypothetical protein